MRVLILTGDKYDRPCGVSDYTTKLARALSEQNVDVTILTDITWSLRNFFKNYRCIDKLEPDIIHIQFPSAGFGHGIIAQLLSIKYRAIVTLHEVSMFHIIRKAWLIPFTFRSTIIFTTDFEKNYFKNFFFWANKNTSVIPIGSNIGDFSVRSPGFGQRKVFEIVHFGLIRPKKGIEDVIYLAQLLKKRLPDYRIKIIGQVSERNQSYYNSIRDAAKDLPVDWAINLSEKQVVEELSSRVIAYLPYPEGASERRGSLLAALSSNMLVFSTKGEQTPVQFEELLWFTKAPLDVVEALIRLKPDRLEHEFETKVNAINSFMQRYNWEEIAKNHIRVYKTHLNLD